MKPRPLPLFHSNDFLEPSDEGGFYYVMGVVRWQS
jgi:hypothetical protein